MKAEKEPEEFEFGCEDLTKDWFDEISDMEEPEEKIKCDENDFFDNEQDSVEPDSKPDKARTGGIWDWDSEDYWAYGESERSLLEMAHKDMYYILWQHWAWLWVKHSGIRFDVIHHVTMNDYRIPSELYKAKGAKVI